MPDVSAIIELLRRRGDSRYGGEAVSQLEHALQAAWLAENEGAAPSLIAAALLHDVGHMLHDLPSDAPDSGVDDRHENAGRNYLRAFFPESVLEPIRLHVAAKRYLCTVDPGYLSALSRPSIVSLELQGGPMSSREVLDFEKQQYAQDAVRLRRWDDAAKIPNLATPPLAHFAGYLSRVAIEKSSS
jgi:phosphonate degradation associated HDIG domain protein